MKAFIIMKGSIKTETAKKLDSLEISFSEKETIRSEAEKFSQLYRDVRLAQGRYYTEGEFREEIKRVLALRLP